MRAPQNAGRWRLPPAGNGRKGRLQRFRRFLLLRVDKLVADLMLPDQVTHPRIAGRSEGKSADAPQTDVRSPQRIAGIVFHKSVTRLSNNSSIVPEFLFKPFPLTIQRTLVVTRFVNPLVYGGVE